MSGGFVFAKSRRRARATFTSHRSAWLTVQRAWHLGSASSCPTVLPKTFGTIFRGFRSRPSVSGLPPLRFPTFPPVDIPALLASAAGLLVLFRAACRRLAVLLPRTATRSMLTVNFLHSVQPIWRQLYREDFPSLVLLLLTKQTSTVWLLRTLLDNLWPHTSSNCNYYPTRFDHRAGSAVWAEFLRRQQRLSVGRVRNITELTNCDVD